MKRLIVIALIAASAWFWLRRSPTETRLGRMDPAMHESAPDLLAAASASVWRVQALVAGFLLATKDPNRPPVGDNEDLVRALRGGNRYGDVWLRFDDPMLNERGQLVDPWGTPLHLHPRAPDAIDIRSAGPDRVLFTEDDLTAGAGSASGDRGTPPRSEIGSRI